MPKKEPIKKEPSRPLTAMQVADRTGVSRSMIYKLAASGELAGFRVGKAWRFLPEVVAAMTGAK